jgi:hypothetical protein
MDWACSTHGSNEKCLQIFRQEILREEITWKKWSSMGGYCLNGSQAIATECMDWVHLARDRFQWRALLSTVMNIQVS